MPINCTFLLNNQPLTTLSCSYLRSMGPTLAIPGTTVKAYGTVEVR